MPLFIPIPEMGDKFSHLLDKYPVSPYLDKKESFIRWVHFIHNKVNQMIGKPEVSYLKSIDNYYSNYKPMPLVLFEKWNIRKYLMFLLWMFLFLFIIYLYQ